MPEFIIRSGKYEGKKLQIDGAQVLIGRDDGCQIRITSQDVSRQHCLIRLLESGWVVRDLGSQNGTFFNGIPLDGERALQPGDRVRVGPMVLELSDGAVKSKRTASSQVASAVSSTTDDDIADWLSDDEIPSAVGDTTIIKAPVKSPEPETPDDDTATTDLPTGLPEPERKFATTAEEAADIIRRHHESLADDETR